MADAERHARYAHVFPPDNIPYRTKLLSQAFERAFQRVLDSYGLTPPQWGVLATLFQGDGVPTLELSRRLEALHGSITFILGQLEDGGYVRREPDDTDRRVIRIWLTTRGRTLERVLPAAASDFLEEALAPLTSRQRAALLKTLTTLRTHVESLASDASNPA